MDLRDFRLLMQAGESRVHPCLTVTYVRVADACGAEAYYREWPYMSAADDEAQLLVSYRGYSLQLSRRRYARC